MEQIYTIYAASLGGGSHVNGFATDPGPDDGRGICSEAEYLGAGVTVVVVLEELPPTARVFRVDGTTRELGPDEALRFPDLLPGFSVQVGRFFE
ncbi:MAG: hypothetical protein JWN86_2600 [Planctomycetota bacterium]|nr:hypothetical protein [Planctomycetota bacterium]